MTCHQTNKLAKLTSASRGWWKPILALSLAEFTMSAILFWHSAIPVMWWLVPGPVAVAMTLPVMSIRMMFEWVAPLQAPPSAFLCKLLTDNICLSCVCTETTVFALGFPWCSLIRSTCRGATKHLTRSGSVW
jgi:hypothetical protein